MTANNVKTSPSTSSFSFASDFDFKQQNDGRMTGLDKSDGVEPIAIVGMACRLPGDANSPSQLWDMLVQGRSGQCDIPRSRFNVEAFHHPDGLNRPGSMSTTGGYFLKEDIRDFENSFFGINNREATYMDPQQRKLLEVVYECFENAGAPLHELSGSNTGCYVGNFTVDYQTMQTRDSEYLHRYSATGMGTTILGNRISHVFDLRGPSLVLDTACSSSLYCLHTAVVALRNSECDAAVVAGANLIQSPEQHLGTMKAGVLSATSTCHTFDASADGYGRADGIGAIYVKRLSDAIRNGDPIRSVIRGTAVNANGKTPGITLPSAAGQEAVIRKAYAAAGISMAETAYVECHGTGTPVGDPIEVEALAQAFNERPEGTPLLIGSIKTNLGHSEAASGISSIIKTTLALEAGIIPPTIGVRKLNPKIKDKHWNIEVVTSNTLWPGGSSETAAPRRAGVNSFGYGGANAHAILEAADSFVAPNYQKSPISACALRLLNKKFLLPFSATSKQSLENRVKNLDVDHLNIADLAYTLSSRRSKLPVRGFLLSSQKDFKGEMQAENFQTHIPTPNNRTRSPFAFVFTGQGAQWPEMGKGLIEQYPSVRSSIQRMDCVLQALPHPPNWTIFDALTIPDEMSKIDKVTHSQPVCTAIQIALVDILACWDIKAQGVVGHSSGEIAAAYAAGILSVDQAITIAYYRGFAVDTSNAKGLMMAVGLSKNDAHSAIKDADLESDVNVACINSPGSVTVSGDTNAVKVLQSRLSDRKVFAKVLATSGRAYHSHHMSAAGEKYETLLGSALKAMDGPAVMQPGVIFISSVTAKPVIRPIEECYWRANLESPVLFSPALQELLNGRDFQLIELGPHSALKQPITQLREHLGLAETDLPYYSALSRGLDSAVSLLRLVGNLFMSGVDVSFQKVNSLDAAKMTDNKFGVVKDLPPYKWTYEQVLWSESRQSAEYRHRKYPRHELLGSLMPGGNHLDSMWRNVLHVKDVPWLEDHRLDLTNVFPATAYLSMAIEALSQVKEKPLTEGMSVELRHVNILTALTLPSRDSDTAIEIFTSLQPQPISAVSKSKTWWQFEIVSFKEGVSTTHATGTIRLAEADKRIHRAREVSASAERSAMRSWYDKMIKEGLNFGPHFQTITQLQLDRKRTAKEAITEVLISQYGPSATEKDSRYLIHPITMDAMLQTAIIASTGGIIRNIKAKVPVKIEHAIIKGPSASALLELGHIHANAKPTGFGTTNISAELYTNEGQSLAQLNNVRLASYAGATEGDGLIERHPMLRVVWKPDLIGQGSTPSNALSVYLDKHKLCGSLDRTTRQSETYGKLLSVLDLLSHKNPRLRILELSDSSSNKFWRACLTTLRQDSAFQRYHTYAIGNLDDNGIFAAKDFGATTSTDSNDRLDARDIEDVYDLILLTDLESTDRYCGRKFDVLNRLLANRGMLLACSRPNKELFLTEKGIPKTLVCLSNEETNVILAQKFSKGSSRAQNLSNVIMVEGAEPSVLGDEINKRISPLAICSSRITLSDACAETIPRGSIAIVTLELTNSLLATVDDVQLAQVKAITNNASTIIWITSSALLDCRNPDMALVNGLSRAIMLEQPSLNFFTLDVDGTTQPHVTAEHVVDILMQANDGSVCDFEYVEREGVIHVSRFVPDESLNETFRQKQKGQPVEMTLQEARPSQLFIQNIGQLDTICFQQELDQKPLDPDSVEIEVRSFGLNAKDLYVLSGKVETKDSTCALEYSGIVKTIGSSVTLFCPGDRVVVMAPCRFQLVERAPQWACQKMTSSEDFNTISTLCVVYVTALYGLRHRGQLKSNESVLIHSGAGGVGLAAIQVAKLIGANIFTTVSTSEKKEYLVSTFGLDPAHIFNSRDSSFLDGILDATEGRGVDVVLNSLTGDLLHDSWRACAEFGRFVEIGKRDIVDSGSLDMQLFSRSTTFTAFDLSSLYYHSNPAMQQTWSNLMKTVLEMYRSTQIFAIEPLKIFDVSQSTDAFRYFSSKSRMGKVAISLENPDSKVKVLPFKHQTSFSSDKSYLLVGCLGGLGRALAKWMMVRGARKLVFLGRSGIDRPEARGLVTDLEAAGAQVTVVRGDVGNLSDVQNAVGTITGPIGGVIQAAMGLSESLFTNMARTSWHLSLDPKLRGTWNLHNALAVHEANSTLDFFLMTSSVSGSVGTATESNYCAANHFLDAFARYRMNLGLPAISLGLGMISEVGYLHENPDIEALLLRKGIQAINEEEMIQIVDLALSRQTEVRKDLALDPLACSHILTGLEPLGLKELRKKGFEGTNPILDDPRAMLLAGALNGKVRNSPSEQNLAISSELTSALESSGILRDAVMGLIVKRFLNLVLIPAAKLDMLKPLGKYGMDSMLAAEFRTWIYKTFKTDVPFLELLSESVTLSSLVDLIEDEVKEKIEAS